MKWCQNKSEYIIRISIMASQVNMADIMASQIITEYDTLMI